MAIDSGWLPINSMVIFHSYVAVYQRVQYRMVLCVYTAYIYLHTAFVCQYVFKKYLYHIYNLEVKLDVKKHQDSRSSSGWEMI